MRESDLPKVSFRKAELSDLPLLVEMENRSFMEVDRFSRRTIRRYLENPSGSVMVDLIEDHEGPVGYAVLLTRRNSKGVSLHSICILPEMRGRGIAHSYLKTRMDRLRGKYNSLVLRVRVSNQSAAELYHSLGFKDEGIEHGYYPDGEDAIKMAKEITRK